MVVTVATVSDLVTVVPGSGSRVVVCGGRPIMKVFVANSGFPASKSNPRTCWPVGSALKTTLGQDRTVYVDEPGT